MDIKFRIKEEKLVEFLKQIQVPLPNKIINRHSYFILTYDKLENREKAYLKLEQGLDNDNIDKSDVESSHEQHQYNITISNNKSLMKFINQQTEVNQNKLRKQIKIKESIAQIERRSRHGKTS